MAFLDISVRTLCRTPVFRKRCDVKWGRGVWRNAKNPARPDSRLARNIFWLTEPETDRTPTGVTAEWAAAVLKRSSIFFTNMSLRSSILPDDGVFTDFRRQCLSTDNWVNKYDSHGMQVWVELPAKKEKRGPKIHKIKVSWFFFF